MDLQAQIKKTMIDMIETVYSKSEKEILSIREFTLKFEELWGTQDQVSTDKNEKNKQKEVISNTNQASSSSTTTPIKKPRKKIIVEESARCFALKKDGGRCAAKAYTGGMNPKLCTLHNNKGANFGMHQEVLAKQEPSPVSTKEESVETPEQSSSKSVNQATVKKVKASSLSEEKCLLSDAEEEVFSDPEEEPELDGPGDYDEKELFGDIDSENEDCLF